MATLGTYTVNNLRFAKIEITVKTSKQFRFRLWCAVWLIRLAGLILGCGIEVKESGD